jgi:hypothetical protein
MSGGAEANNEKSTTVCDTAENRTMQNPYRCGKLYKKNDL